MANQISGKVLFIENTVTVPTKSGGTFTKRQIVLDASHYDQMTGQKILKITPLSILSEIERMS